MNICKHCGNPANPHAPKKDRNRKVYYMREAGCYLKDIAKKFNISPTRAGSIYRKERQIVEAEESRKRMGLKIGD